MAEYLRSLFARADELDPPPPSRRDAVVAGLVALVALADIPEDIPTWQPATALVAMASSASLVMRRSRPLVVVGLVFGLEFLLKVGSGLADVESDLPFGHLVVLTVATYGLARWANWRNVMVGIGAIITLEISGELLATTTGWSELADLGLFCGAAAAVGVAVRYRSATIKLRADQVRSVERERIARELHDVVAHHVSAIAIQAEGGRAMAAADPTGAEQVLGTIHSTASKALLDLRQVVSILREPGADGELTPHAGVAELAALATSAGELPAVEVTIDGDADQLAAGVESAVFRIAQEAVTNARRHGDKAGHVSVSLVVDRTSLTLTITDDGRGSSIRSEGGYGLIGMFERATLLGGTFTAGRRDTEPGWRVQATIPINESGP